MAYARHTDRLLALCFTLGAMATATEKDKGGRPANKPLVDPLAIIEETVKPGRSGARLARATGIGQKVSREIMRVTAMTIEEFQDAQRKKLQEISDMALEQTRSTIDKASALQSATVFGILSDKLNKPVANQTLHIHLAPGDRSGALAALLGKHGERVLPEKPNQTKVVKMAGPVVDLAPESGHVLQSGDS